MCSTRPDPIRFLNGLVLIILSVSRHFFQIKLCDKLSVEFFLMLTYKEALVCLNLSVKLLAPMFLLKTPKIMGKPGILVIISEGIKMERWNQVG